jgi:enterobactin synthetase component D
VVSRRRAARVGPLVVDRHELLAARAAALDEALGVTLLFSAKETLFKCLFPVVRRWFGYDAARIRPNEDGSFDARLTVALSDGLPAGTVVSGRWTVSAGRVYTALFLTRD